MSVIFQLTSKSNKYCPKIVYLLFFHPGDTKGITQGGLPRILSCSCLSQHNIKCKKGIHISMQLSYNSGFFIKTGGKKERNKNMINLVGIKFQAFWFLSLVFLNHLWGLLWRKIKVTRIDSSLSIFYIVLDTNRHPENLSFFLFLLTSLPSSNTKIQLNSRHKSHSPTSS